MSLENSVDTLKSQHKSLDESVHGLAKVCAEIKNLVLTNQQDVAGLKGDVAGLKGDVAALKGDVVGIKSDIIGVKSDITLLAKGQAALTEAILAGFKRSDEQHAETQEQIKQLEQLVRQSRPTN